MKVNKVLWFTALCLIIIIIFLGVSQYRPSSPENPRTEEYTAPSRAEGEPLKAALIDQLDVHFPNPEFIQGVDTIMQQTGYTLDVYGPDEVTLNLYKSLPARGYDLIVFRVYAGIKGARTNWPVCLFTTEPYSIFRYPREQLSDRVVSAQTYDQGEKVFAVTPDFIRENSITDYDGSLIILMGGFGLYSENLPSAFIERGASRVVGWNGLVGIDHTDKATLALVRMILVDKMPIQDAVHAVLEEVGLDPDNRSKLKYYPDESECKPCARARTQTSVSQPKLQTPTIAYTSIGVLRAKEIID